jgi:Dyp-type peroxidase family
MAVDLTAPLAWKTAAGDAATLLDELQPNILKGHVRDHLSVVFLHFDRQDEARTFLGDLVQLMKSARTHLEEVEAFKTSGASGTPYVGVGLTAAGYAALGVADDQIPADPSFRASMKASATRTKLMDPPVTMWEPQFREEIHAVVLIGDATDAGTSTRRLEVGLLLPDSVTVVGEETGLSQINGDGNGIEHFGYVDGRSQPLFLVEDVDNERQRMDGTTVWDPAFGLDRVLVADPAAPDPATNFGSYFIFRKLEQNVQRFKQAEEDLADELGLTGEDRERAGAMIVGRFEDGTPVVVQSEGGAHSPVMNDFDYDSDPAGAKCPFHGHIRKSNPRGSGGVEAIADERKHLMARRGQTYGRRLDDPTAELDPSQRPTGGVGLLFMAFNAELAQQFEFTQASWANSAAFPQVPDGAAAPGLDPIIGQGPRTEATYPVEWGGTDIVAAHALPQSVQMKGGDYFFMPSLAFLRSL